MVEIGFVLIEGYTDMDSSDYHESVEPNNEEKPAKVSNKVH